ncbi:MAG: hypothetical protein Q4B28_02260 [bacterium]|nr:hypothetical protein [bacterium]
MKNYLLNGYALNQKRLQEKGIKELENTLQVFRKTIEQLPMS